MMLKVGSDLDDTINIWYDEYLKRFGIPKNDAEITRNVHNILRKDRKFWLNLPVKHKPDFELTLFCTKRVNSKRWTKKWLKDNNICPNAPVYQLYYQKGSKAPLIKGKVDVFIEDSVGNFIDLNSKGIPCLLIDSPYNKEWEGFGRIYSLHYSEIEEVYLAGMESGFFKNFNKE